MTTTQEDQEILDIGAIIRAADNDGDLDDVTESVIGIVLDEHRQTAEQLLAPIVRAAISRARRKAARAKEDEAFKRGQDKAEAKAKTGTKAKGAAKTEAKEDRLVIFRELAAELFWVPNGTRDGDYIRWDEATAEEHIIRADFQRNKAGAEIEDAVRHEEAARIINDADADCLSRVPGF